MAINSNSYSESSQCSSSLESSFNDLDSLRSRRTMFTTTRPGRGGPQQRSFAPSNHPPLSLPNRAVISMIENIPANAIGADLDYPYSMHLGPNVCRDDESKTRNNDRSSSSSSRKRTNMNFVIDTIEEVLLLLKDEDLLFDAFPANQ